MAKAESSAEFIFADPFGRKRKFGWVDFGMFS